MRGTSAKGVSRRTRLLLHSTYYARRGGSGVARQSRHIETRLIAPARADAGYEPTREAAMAAFADFTSMLEICRQQLDRIALGYGSTDCANAIPRSREETLDLCRFAFWQFSHYERIASLEHPCSSICRVSRC